MGMRSDGSWRGLVVRTLIDQDYLLFLTGRISASEYYGNDGLDKGTPGDVYTNIEGTAESDLEDC